MCPTRPGPRPASGRALERMETLAQLEARIVRCRLCPRLVAWREEVARTRRRAFADQEYWGKPVPGFGDPQARLLVLGLAPAAHGGNRTGRVFTGDRSGDYLYDALHHAGFASQAEAVSRDDGLRLTDAFVTAGVRCCPPDNKPLPEESLACRPFLEEELRLLDRVVVVVALGGIAFDTALRLLPHTSDRKPRFAHGARFPLASPRRLLIASYHPSQQNTFTGRLTHAMLRDIFLAARAALDE